MQEAATGKKRPYMASHDRRRALLEAAAEMVSRGGWNALTMKGLAAEAGVSRQLISASWGLADLVDDGTVGKKQATETLVHLVEQVMVPGRSPRSPGGHRNAATSPRSRTRKRHHEPTSA